MARIERLLAQCLDAMEQGDSLEECLARYPERREELEPLLLAALRVRSAPTIAPSEAFRQGARERMLNAIRTGAPAKAPDRVPKRAGLPDRLRLDQRLPLVFRRLAVPALATIIVVALLGTIGIGAVYASSDSLPGDSLYPVKLAGERVRLALSPGPVAEARLRLHLAGERVEEATRLTEEGLEDHVGTLMDQYAREVEVAADILQDQQEKGRDVTSLSQHLRARLAEQQAMLGEIRDLVSRGSETAVDQAVAASIAAEKRVAAAETPVPGEDTEPSRTPTPTETPTDTAEPPEGLAPTNTPQPPGQTKTPEPPGQTKTPQPPGQTKTPQPPGQTNTPQPPGRTNTPQPPGQTKTPQPPGRTNTPQPPGRTNTPQPPGQTNTPQPPGQTNTPQPPGQTNTPQPPGQTNTPQPPGQTNTPQPPGQTKTPQPPGQTDTSKSGP